MTRSWQILLIFTLPGCKGNATHRVEDGGASAAAERRCKGTEPAVALPDGLAFLDQVSGNLDVELTEAPVRITPNLLNEKALPTATIKSVTLEAQVMQNDDFRPLTAVELDRVVFRGAVLKLRGLGKPVTHTSSDCQLTVRDVLDAVEETERQTRGDSEWFEGVDVHHVYFEGLDGGDDGVWQIHWGS